MKAKTLEQRVNILEKKIGIKESLSIDGIVGEMWEKYQDDQNWELKVKRECRLLMLSKDETLQVINELHGEDYFDDGDIEFS